MAAGQEIYSVSGQVQKGPQHPQEAPAAWLAQAFEFQGLPFFGSVEINLNNTKIVADQKSLVYMEGVIEQETDCFGGCKDGFWRSCAGESCCLNTYSGTGKIAFGFMEPGDMIALHVPGTENTGYLLNQGAFVVGSDNLKVTAKCNMCAFAAEEGAMLTKIISEDGQDAIAFVGGFGGIVRHDIPAGKTLFVDNGMFFAATTGQNFRLELFGLDSDASCQDKCMSTLCGGEGLVMAFDGPCTIWTQSRDSKILKPRVADSDNSGGNE